MCHTVVLRPQFRYIVFIPIDLFKHCGTEGLGLLSIILAEGMLQSSWMCVCYSFMLWYLDNHADSRSALNRAQHVCTK